MPGQRSAVSAMRGRGVFVLCFRVPLLFAVWWSTALSTFAIDFVRDVRPIFEGHCYDCHGAEKRKSGLRLDVKVAALKGGDNHGPDILPGDAANSPLIHFLTTKNDEERMPPKGARLSVGEIATLTAWIDAGALWPDGVDEVELKDPKDHWSFYPLRKSPEGKTIDDFIEKKLTENGLSFSPEADRVSWLRRVSFDLIGLPPSPKEVADFLKDEREDAFVRVVERLLDSPRYGERWGQHWLDVVRYADTHGFEVNTERPNAWPYRDYVIRAFNDDTPYDRFVREQIAGDALGKDAATGFLVTASVLLPGQIGKDEPSKRLARQDSIDEIVMNIGQSFLGLSIGCARCHDHKFDPITAKDYYAMQAFVAGVEYKDRELHTPEADVARKEEAQWKTRLAEIDKSLAYFVPLANSGVERPMISSRENSDRFSPLRTKQVRFTVQATNSLEPCLDELEVFDTEGNNVALATAGTKRTSSGDTGVAERHELRFINDGKYGNSRSWMSSEKGRGWIVLEFPEEKLIERVVWGRDREGKFKDRLAIRYQIEVTDGKGRWKTVANDTDRKPFEEKGTGLSTFSTTGLTSQEAKEASALVKERGAVEAEIKAAVARQRAFAGVFREPDEIRLLSRGDPEQPKEVVEPAVLSAFGKGKWTATTPEQERRLALADWITDPQNPLTARVMVNRIWQGHFGTGLVATPSDFGNNGMSPSHPELLDWLAEKFLHSAWSVKEMHRLIVLSRTYRQSSSSNPDGNTKDADVRLLWRYPSRRLEAEAIRDSILEVSGKLNLKMYGRGYDLFDQRGGLSGFDPVESYEGEGLRRMVYAHKVRRETEAVFGAFDCPDAGQSSPKRRESTTPIQALNLFNSVFTLEQSEAFAERVKMLAGNDLEKQIEQVYQQALTRPISLAEREEALVVGREYGLATLCRALFNSNEFLFVP